MTTAPSAPAERDIAWTTIAAGLLTLGAIGGIPLGRLGEPEEVARVVRFLSSDNAGYITGQVWGVNGGLDM